MPAYPSNSAGIKLRFLRLGFPFVTPTLGPRMGIKTSNLRFAAMQLTPACSTPRPVPAPPNDCRASTIPRAACRSATRCRSQTSTPRMPPAASSDPGPAATATLTNENNVQPTTKYTSAVFRLDRQPCCSLTGSWKYSTILGDYGMSAPASPHAGGGVLHLGVARRHRAGQHGNLHSTGISPFIAKPVPVPLQGSRLNTFFYVVCSYSGRPRISLASLLWKSRSNCA